MGMREWNGLGGLSTDQKRRKKTSLTGVVQAARPAYDHVTCRTKKLKSVTDSLTNLDEIIHLRMRQIPKQAWSSKYIHDLVNLAEYCNARKTYAVNFTPKIARGFCL